MKHIAPPFLLVATFLLVVTAWPSQSLAYTVSANTVIETRDGIISALAVSPSTIYVGGNFESIGPVGGPFQELYGLVRLDRAEHTLQDWNPSIPWPEGVESLALSGTTLYVQGTFKQVNGELRNGLAAFDVTTGALLSWNPAVEQVTHVLRIDERVYILGLFTEVNGAPRSGIAAFDAATGDLLPSTIHTDGHVNTLVAQGDRLYVGGKFSSINGAAREALAVVDKDTGEVLPWNPQLTDQRTVAVGALAVDERAVYIGGNFAAVNGVKRYQLAAVSVADGETLPWNPYPSLYSDYLIEERAYISGLHSDGSIVYVAGRFGYIGGKARTNIAAVTAVTGRATDWNPQVQPCRSTSTVYDFAVSERDVYIVNPCTYAGNVANHSELIVTPIAVPFYEMLLPMVQQG